VAESLWSATTPTTDYPPLEDDAVADVAVVGGGIVGLATALLVAEAGADAVVLEAGRVARGVSGNTTAKLTSQHGLRYRELVSRAGRETARLYAEANEGSIEWVSQLELDCEFQRAPAFVWADNLHELERVRDEVTAARDMGLPAHFESEVPLPFPTRGAVRFDDQALIHPRKLLLGLADRFVHAGGRIYEQTRVTDLSEGKPNRARTASGRTVRARTVVLATNIPFPDRGLYFARLVTRRGYAIAAELDATSMPAGMFINAGSPTRSLRPASEGGRPLLLVGGEGHVTGAPVDTARRWETLEHWARGNFPIGAVRYRWSTQDQFATDHRPFVGPLRPGSANVHVATGLGGWGMSGGIAAAQIIASHAVGKTNEHASAFDPFRLSAAFRTDFVRHNIGAARGLVLRRLATHDTDPETLRPGEGAVIREGRRLLAVSRRETGELDAVSAACTHLGCIVRWNAAERSWDCPCHGSRFAPEGDVLHGPAVEPLANAILSAAP
jgi:glycine/D-amino acid oxidase-like deaminating enzyme/nitrite reductase/ring-hydroxylating ferredoxin subunit